MAKRPKRKPVAGKCKPGTVLNPTTGNCVKIGGATYFRLLAEGTIRPTITKSKPEDIQKQVPITFRSSSRVESRPPPGRVSSDVSDIKIDKPPKVKKPSAILSLLRKRRRRKRKIGTLRSTRRTTRERKVRRRRKVGTLRRTTKERRPTKLSEDIDSLRRLRNTKQPLSREWNEINERIQNKLEKEKEMKLKLQVEKARKAEKKFEEKLEKKQRKAEKGERKEIEKIKAKEAKEEREFKQTREVSRAKREVVKAREERGRIEAREKSEAIREASKVLREARETRLEKKKSKKADIAKKLGSELFKLAQQKREEAKRRQESLELKEAGQVLREISLERTPTRAPSDLVKKRILREAEDTRRRSNGSANIFLKEQIAKLKEAPRKMTLG